MNQNNNYGVVLEPTEMEVKLYRVSKVQTLEQKPAADRYVELYNRLHQHKARLAQPKQPWYRRFSLNSL